MRKVLIFQGGWDGHEPQLTSKRFARLMEEEGYQAEISDTLDCLLDYDKLLEYHLLVACWTMGSIPWECSKNIARAVGAGVGLAGDRFPAEGARPRAHGAACAGALCLHAGQ